MQLPRVFYHISISLQRDTQHFINSRTSPVKIARDMYHLNSITNDMKVNGANSFYTKTDTCFVTVWMHGRYCRKLHILFVQCWADPHNITWDLYHLNCIKLWITGNTASHINISKCTNLFCCYHAENVLLRESKSVNVWKIQVYTDINIFIFEYHIKEIRRLTGLLTHWPLRDLTTVWN